MMFGLHDTDKECRKWGDADPYYAVLSEAQYRNRQNQEAFFESGGKHLIALKLR